MRCERIWLSSGWWRRKDARGLNSCNASVLPLVVEALVYEGERRSSLVVSALIVLPQILVALMAPWVGRQAKNWGRRPLLLIGFGALPVRALLFALVLDPPLLIVLQLLDG